MEMIEPQFHCTSPRLNTIPQNTTNNQPNFDIGRWHPQLKICLAYFLDIAQYTESVQALAAFINIRLPFQKDQNIAINSSAAHNVSLVPYIRRLVATGQDTQLVLHGFFGDNWIGGIGAIHELERRNYLFAAKSTTWIGVKQAYDILPNETVPFLSPLLNVTEREMQTAEDSWSEWIFMQDWMLGPRLENMTQIDETDKI
ncbi:hypothetical protein GcC1_181018 [Golovinomyces cichoracearum]|uniref:Uncharacterized protein n=1 Tax=Golovinomyces cichoracearum TaxID=62708 RepID=A0A420HMS7_9PEZI|nr:hypothetical protein GcC1_181018 [Golovinomyces cichoracearum]